jgi:uncharacterized protein YccT (UPF0319 family)
MKHMEPIRGPEILARAAAAFDLCQTAENIMRQSLRRWHPEASEEELHERFAAWVEKRDYVEPSSAPET